MGKNQISGGDGVGEGQRGTRGGKSRTWRREVRMVTSFLEAKSLASGCLKVDNSVSLRSRAD